MDINDERQCETQLVNVKNRKNATTIDITKTQQLAEKLSTIEKEDLANKYDYSSQYFLNEFEIKSWSLQTPNQRK